MDGLDAALSYDPEDNIVTLLAHTTERSSSLPPQMRFLLTTRHDPRVLSLMDGVTLDLIHDAPESAEEVRAYAYTRLSALPESKRTDVAERVAEAAQGNFLYARYMLDHLLSDPNGVDDMTPLALPQGLNDVYRQSLKREIGRNMERWSERYCPLLGALAEAHEPGLTLTQLGGITGRSMSESSNLLRALAQYLDGPQPEGPLRLYHPSFRQFLLHDLEFPIYPAEANEAIATFFLEEYHDDWLNCNDPYALQWVCQHFINAVRDTTERRGRRRLLTQLSGLFADFTFLEARTIRYGLHALLGDLSIAETLDWAGSDSKEAVLGLQAVLSAEAQNLSGWDPAERPAFFAQQVRNRAWALGLSDLVSRAEARLAVLPVPSPMISMPAPIFHHLCGIALLKEYIYHHMDLIQREMYFLKDNGFIKPRTPHTSLEFNGHLNGVNLAEIVEPTELGWRIVKRHKKDIPSGLLQHKENLKIDPSAL